MGHNHKQHHGDTGNIKAAFFLNLLFTFIEIIGGFLTNSLAIISDALHDLGDSLSLGLAWYFQNISKKGRDRNFSYGYKRFSLIGAIINSVVLICGSIFILLEAIPRLITPEETNAEGMFLLAVLGIVVNGIAFIRLRKGGTLNEKVVSLHLLEDVLGWVAVLIGAAIIYFFNLLIIDPILSMFISVFVLINVYRNLKQVFNIVMQGIPSDTNINAIKNYLISVDGVTEIHDLHVWSLDGIYNILTVHLVITNDKNVEELSNMKKEIRNELHKLGIEHATLEFERDSEKCVLINC